VKTVLPRIWICKVDWKPMFRGQLAQGMAQWCAFLEVALKTPLAIDCSPRS